MRKLWLLMVSVMLASGGLGSSETGWPMIRPISLEQDTQVKPRDEDHRYNIGTVVVEGAKLFSAKQILRVSGLIPRTALTEGAIETATAHIKKAYADRGYVGAKVSIDQNLRPMSPGAKTGIVDLTISIREGSVFFVRWIEFVGNAKTRDKVLRRTLLIREGQRYNPAFLDRSIQRLNKIGWFEEITRDNVRVELEETEHQVDITFYVQEKVNP